jgi:hypothetical protein
MSRLRHAAAHRDARGANTTLPSFDDLVLDPELAPLALLEAAGHVLIQALVAANPEMLQCADRPASALEPMTVAAYRVVAACRGLHDALDIYRARLGEARERGDTSDDDIPF